MAVGSLRHGRKVVQQTGAQLGELDAQGRARAQALSRSITGKAADSSQRRLFEADAPMHASAVQLGKVRLERSQAFGAVWSDWLFWRTLKLDEMCGQFAGYRSGECALGRHAATLVSGRLCEPSSEL